MKIITDTNILFSALLFPDSNPAKALLHIVEHHNLILCDYIVSELRNVVSRKRPDLLADIDVLLAKLPFELVSAPLQPSKLISDPKDHPIFFSPIYPVMVISPLFYIYLLVFLQYSSYSFP